MKYRYLSRSLGHHLTGNIYSDFKCVVKNGLGTKMGIPEQTLVLICMSVTIYYFELA